MRDFLVQSPLFSPIRRYLIPGPVARMTKQFWRARVPRPVISQEQRQRLAKLFDDDLARLGSWLGTELNCENFYDKVGSVSGRWTREVETLRVCDSCPEK